MKKYNQLFTQEEVDNCNEPLPSGNSFKSKVGMIFGKLEVIKFAGLSKSGKSEYFCKCECGNIVKRDSGNLSLSKSALYENSNCGCRYGSHIRLSLSEMQKRVSEDTPYEIVHSEELWESVWTLRCSAHGIFERRYASLLGGKYGCPDCASHGFNPKKRTSFYINSICDTENNLLAFKFGITNQDLKDRNRQIKERSNVSVETIFYFTEEEGYFIQELEKYCKIVIPGNFLSRDLVPNGFTETFSPQYLVELLQIIENINKEIYNASS